MTLALVAVTVLALVTTICLYSTIVKLNRRHYVEMKEMQADAKEERNQLYSRLMSRDETHYQSSRKPTPLRKPPRNFIKDSIERHEQQNMSE